VHAGDPAFQARTRTIGVVHYDQDPPIYDDLTARMTERYEAMGAEADVIISYLLDTNTTAQQAQGIIGRLKEEQITTVVFAGDPFMLMDLVNAAGRQNYAPEWVITGTVFTDTTAVGRLIVDQEQWAHAFGASSSPARGKPEQSETWRLYRWFHGKDPEAKKSLQVTGPVVQLLFTGIHLAGPDLTPETFAGWHVPVPAVGRRTHHPPDQLRRPRDLRAARLRGHRRLHGGVVGPRPGGGRANSRWKAPACGATRWAGSGSSWPIPRRWTTGCCSRTSPSRRASSPRSPSPIAPPTTRHRRARPPTRREVDPGRVERVNGPPRTVTVVRPPPG
jgi:hypothetical protein